MTFYESIEQDGKNLCLITGSPTNDGDGDPGYKLLDEKTNHKCERGSLVTTFAVPVLASGAAAALFFSAAQQTGWRAEMLL